ncbi:MAG: lipopolysaccharide biosynthesis protein [Nitrospira sp.]|nr:lipopolysaccharide biosynthesis protein [Nitrospira sp.]
MNVPALQQKLFHGSMAGLVRVALAIPVYLVLTPVVLHALGPEQFGIWAFSTLVISLMNVTDFGLKDSLVYHVAKHNEQPDEARQCFSVTLWSYVAIALLLVIGTAAWGAKAFPVLLNVPASLHEAAVFVLWVTIAGLVWRLLALPYQAVVEGYQELFRSQLIFLAWLGVHFFGTLLALAISPTVYGLGWAGLFGNMFIFAAFFWTVRRRFPHITPRWYGLFTGSVRSMAGFGLGIQIASICIAMREPIYKVLIARSSDLASVASFDIAYKLCTQLMSVMTTPLLGLFGAAAVLAGRHQDLANLLRPLIGWTLGALLPGAIGVAVFAEPLMQRWLGGGDLASGLFLPVMCVGFAVYYATEALYKTIEGSGRSWYSAAVQVTVLLVQVGMFWLLAPSQPQAAAWSLAAGYGLFSLLNLLMFRSLFPEIRVFTCRQWVALLVPSCVYVIGIRMFPLGADPLLFGSYVLVHLAVLAMTGIIDVDTIWRWLTAAGTGFRWALQAANRGTK